MAIDDNLKAEALAELEVIVGTRGAGGFGLDIDKALFIFGIDETANSRNQTNLQLVADYFEALAWVDVVTIEWHAARIWLYNPDPSP